MLLVLTVVGILLAVHSIRRFSYGFLGYYHPACILLGLTCIDVLFPGLLWATFGIPESPGWKERLSENDVVRGLMFYLLFYVIMLSTVTLFARSSHSRCHDSALTISFPVTIATRSRLTILLILTCFMSCLSLYYEMASIGGPHAWLMARSVLRWQAVVAENEPGVIVFILTKLPWGEIFNALVLFAFFVRHALERNILFGIIFPLLGIFLCAFTFFRGAILVFILGIGFFEYMRMKFQVRTMRDSKKRVRMGVLWVGAVLLFLVYGVIRDRLSNEFSSETQIREESYLYSLLAQGSGLDAVSQILAQYDKNVDFLCGKTYFDMLLLPIPRAIYRNKPEWYGIDDITRGMDWAPSTQSAVTIPGEAFANFGWWGLAIAILWGIYFASVVKLVEQRSRLCLLLYPLLIIQLILVGNWMGFTGVMNLALRIFCSGLAITAAIGRFERPSLGSTSNCSWKRKLENYKPVPGDYLKNS